MKRLLIGYLIGAGVAALVAASRAPRYTLVDEPRMEGGFYGWGHSTGHFESVHADDIVYGWHSSVWSDMIEERIRLGLPRHNFS